MNKHQRGLSLIGLLIVSAMLIAAALVVMKCVPVVVEYWNVKKIVSTMAASGDLRGSAPVEIRRSFDRRAVIDNVTVITGKDLQIQKTGDGNIVTFQYESRVPLFSVVSLVFEFQGTSEDRARGG
jgi:Domain of unknown function (DUF4845)